MCYKSAWTQLQPTMVINFLIAHRAGNRSVTCRLQDFVVFVMFFRQPQSFGSIAKDHLGRLVFVFLRFLLGLGPAGMLAPSGPP